MAGDEKCWKGQGVRKDREWRWMEPQMERSVELPQSSRYWGGTLPEGRQEPAHHRAAQGQGCAHEWSRMQERKQPMRIKTGQGPGHRKLCHWWVLSRDAMLLPLTSGDYTTVPTEGWDFGFLFHPICISQSVASSKGLDIALCFHKAPVLGLANSLMPNHVQNPNNCIFDRNQNSSPSHFFWPNITTKFRMLEN